MNPGDWVQAGNNIDYSSPSKKKKVKRGEWGMVISADGSLIQWCSLRHPRYADPADLLYRPKGPPIGPARWKIWTGIAAAICAVAVAYVLPSDYEIFPHTPQQLLNMVQRHGPQFVENVIEEDGAPCVVTYERLGPHHARVVLRRPLSSEQIKVELERLNQRL